MFDVTELFEDERRFRKWQEMADVLAMDDFDYVMRGKSPLITLEEVCGYSRLLKHRVGYDIRYDVYFYRHFEGRIEAVDLETFKKRMLRLLEKENETLAKVERLDLVI